MNLEKSLYYVTHHSESIIQWLFLAVVVIATLIVAGGIFKKRKAAASSSSDHSLGGEQAAEIQASLQRLLLQTAKLENVTLAGAAPGVVADVDAQVKTLRSELSARETEIAALKAAGGTADPASSAATDTLAVRVKELEAKLAEYEILEDDIADLSLFKDENSRLKAELETYKAGGAPTPAAAFEAEPVADTNGVSSADLIVEEFAQVIQQKAEPEVDAATATDVAAAFAAPEPAAEAAPAPAPTPTPAAPAAADPILSMPTSVPPKAALNPFAAAPAAGTEAPAAAPVEAGDLFAEFSIEPPPDEDALDTSKMMAEMDALAAIETSGTDGLEGAIDTDKMAMEATSLTKA